MNVPQFAQPELHGPRRDSLSDTTGAYLRCYLLLRALVGWFGILLPIVLVGGDWPFLDEGVRGSLSDYYHSGMRDVFVGSLCAIAVFLITYKVFERNLDNTLSIVAGIAIVVVALCPTRTSGPLTPLQEEWGEGLVAVFHYIGASVFILSLMVISVFFGVREGRRTVDEGRHSPTFWRSFHWICAGAIGLAVIYIVLSNWVGWLSTEQSLFIGETVAVVAFGCSWLSKGLERDLLRRLKREAAVGREATAEREAAAA